jgi:hypothetical protein
VRAVRGALVYVNCGIEGEGSGVRAVRGAGAERRDRGGIAWSLDVLHRMGAKRRAETGSATDLDVLHPRTCKTSHSGRPGGRM